METGSGEIDGSGSRVFTALPRTGLKAPTWWLTIVCWLQFQPPLASEDTRHTGGKQTYMQIKHQNKNFKIKNAKSRNAHCYPVSPAL